MIEMSQRDCEIFDLKDYLKKVRPKHQPGLLLEDVVTGKNAGRLFQEAKPIELPEFYNEEYKTRPESYEHYNPEAEKRKEAEEFKLPKPLPSKNYYGHYEIRQKSGSDRASFEERVAKYDSSYGKELKSYLKSQGRKFLKLERVGTIPTKPGNPALVAKIGQKAALLGSCRFDEEVEDFARAYFVPKHIAERYILDHEYTHLSQPRLDRITAELDVENTLKNFYLAKAKENSAQSMEYLMLAKIPMMRERNVASVYSKAA